MTAFNDGLAVAIWVGAAVGARALVALLIPPQRRTAESSLGDLVPQVEAV